MILLRRLLLLRRTVQYAAFLERKLLESDRQTRDILIGWRLSLETPELDIRDDLDQLIRELEESIALAEEHIVT